MRTKSFKRKLSNLLLLGILLVIALGIYFNIYNSRAENVIEILAVAHDSYGYLESEEFTLEAKEISNDSYEVELPESVNGKKIIETLKVTLENLIKENSTEENTVTELNVDNQAENTETEEATTDDTATDEPVEDEATNNENIVDETTPQEETTQENVLEENTTTEKAEQENAEEATPVIVEIEVKDNKFQLTKEQIENSKINFEVTYDVAILEKDEEGIYSKNSLTEKTEEERNQIQITEETEVVYSKILKYEDEEHGKLVEVKGFLPKDAELKVEEVTEEQLKEIFGDGKIDVAYDIKILIPTTKEDGTIEYKEVNPEEFGESCEVTIKDANIVTDSQVYHVKEDNTYEQVPVRENEEESISFDAQTFSVYAVSSDDGIMLAAALYTVTFDPDHDETDDYSKNLTVKATMTSRLWGVYAFWNTSHYF